MIPFPTNIDETAYIAPDAIITGDVTVSKNCSIWYHAVIRADHETIFIGKSSNIQDNCVLHVDPGNSITIGEGVTIGHSAIIHGCTIGDNTVVGMGSIIMNHAVIGNNCIIGAGSLVTQNKHIPDNSLIMGSPAKIIRPLTQEEIEHNKANCNHYIQISREYKEQNI